jgi:polar amino acid transport system substrate-binding protein
MARGRAAAVSRVVVMRRSTPALSLLVATALASGCAASSSGGASSGNTPIAASAACTPSQMQTLTPNTLTVGADQPVYEPWFVNNDPTNGKGFEDAVAYAVAKQLGYTRNQVHWVRVPFNAAIQPGPKSFDMDLDEFSITKPREQAVDFSAPYYDVTQAVIAMKGSKAAQASSLADLKSLKLGAQVGTTSYDAIVNDIKPSQQPAVYNSNDDAKGALQAGQIDGLVVDLPTAFYITSAQLKGSTIVGQIPDTSGHPEQFGILLDKGSPLTSCVSKAVTALHGNGTLGRIQDKWLAQVANAPVLH